MLGFTRFSFDRDTTTSPVKPLISRDLSAALKNPDSPNDTPLLLQATSCKNGRAHRINDLGGREVVGNHAFWGATPFLFKLLAATTLDSTAFAWVGDVPVRNWRFRGRRSLNPN